MTNHIDEMRRTVLKATPGLVALGFGGLATASTEVSTAEVTWGGRPHQALGDAVLEATADSLAVTNVDGGWDDGVATAVNDVESLDATLQKKTLEAAGQGCLLRSQGTVGGSPDSLVGQLTVEHDGERLNVTPDFSPLAPAGVSVGVYVDGFRVDTLYFDSYADFWMWGNLARFGWTRYVACGGDRPSFGFGFANQVTLEASNGASAEGNAFLFEATDTDAPVEGLSYVCSRAANVDSYTITGERTR